MVLCGNTAVYLYIGRVFAGAFLDTLKFILSQFISKEFQFFFSTGATGGGMYICLPLFVAEIADQRSVERKIPFQKAHSPILVLILVLAFNA